MSNILQEIFIDKGVYKHNQFREDSIFVCEALTGNRIGKLVMYNKNKQGIYEKTSTQYFLNNYILGDIKELFTRRENYDMVGKIGENYGMSSDGNHIVN